MESTSLERIKQLQQEARPLEPDAAQRERWLEEVMRYTDTFIENAPNLLAFQTDDDEGKGILESPLSETPMPIEQALELVKHHVDYSGGNEGISPGFLAFIPSGGLYASALADYIAGVTNRFVPVSFAAPGAAHLERMVLRWMMDFIGYPATATGDFTSGGSISNLTAIVTAREAHQLKSADYPKSVVYLSDQAHYSVMKGLRIAGLSECIVREVTLDEN